MNSVKCAVQSIDAGHLVFATDYPQEFTDDPLEIKTYIENIRKLEISEKEKELILGGNALSLLWPKN